MHDELARLYPPLGLEITCGDITLRAFRDTDLPAYSELIASPLFDDELAPYVFAWWDRDPAERHLDSLQFLWRQRANVSPASWSLKFGVFEQDRLIGAQDLDAKDFARLRVVHSGSYLRLDAQGRGIGTLMRQMVLVLAFDHLGAERAESAAIVGNERSMAVSRHCGYHLDGMEVVLNGERRVDLQRVAVTPSTFIRPSAPVQVQGLTGDLRRMLGLDPVRAEA